MTKSQAILITLVTYKVLLLAIGFWARLRTRDAADFYLGGRRLGPWVAAVSASASSSSAWTLLGVSGAAFAWGLPALWLFPATVSGFALNWFWVAPKIQELSHREGSITLTDVLARHGGAQRANIARLAAFIIVFSFLFYIASQFQAAGNAFATTFGLSMSTSILIGALIVLAYTWLGGFWAVSVTDTLQGLLMALTALVLPAAAWFAVDGYDGLRRGLAATGETSLSLTGDRAGWIAVAFVLGTLGIGLGYPGQPHVVNRAMALKDRRSMIHARGIAMVWAVIVYAGMLTLGLCGRVLYFDSSQGEQVFFLAADGLFPPVVAGIMVAAVLSAIMSTADSQLLVAGSAVTHDLGVGMGREGQSLMAPRLVVLGLSTGAALLALFAPAQIFSRVLFAWHAVGSAFGPLLLLRLAGFRVSGSGTLAAMSVGFALTVFLHQTGWLNAHGDIAERLLPFGLALLIGWLSSTKVRQPSPVSR